MKKIFKKEHKLAILKHLKKNKALVSYKSNLNSNYLIIAKNSGLITWKNLELFRRAISKLFKGLGKKDFKLIIFVTRWRFYTKKPLLSRMGKGSGPVSFWRAFITDGSVIIKISSTKPKNLIFNIWKKAAKLFPLRTGFESNY